MKEKERLIFDSILALSVMGFLGFVLISFLTLTYTDAGGKDIYTVVFSLVGNVIGGLVGGFITLKGVQLTIKAQKEEFELNIAVQKEQEAMKLIPNKIVALYELEKLCFDFSLTISDTQTKLVNIIDRLLEENPHGIFPEHTTLLDRLREEFSKLRTASFERFRYECIASAAKIDIDTYKEIKELFDTFEKETHILGRKESWHEELTYEKAIAFKHEIKHCLRNNVSHCLSCIQFVIKKIDEYGQKEIL